MQRSCRARARTKHEQRAALAVSRIHRTPRIEPISHDARIATLHGFAHVLGERRRLNHVFHSCRHAAVSQVSDEQRLQQGLVAVVADPGA